MRFYKTTRMDGGSWYDPEFVYKEGQVRRPKQGTLADSYWTCTDGVLHACSIPAAAASPLWGVCWPFLLWSFEGTPVTGRGTKYGFRQVGPMVVEDVTQCFGPNGAQVVALLKTLAGASPEELGSLGLVRDWSNVAYSTVIARNVVSRGGRDASRWEARDAAQGAARGPIKNYAARNAAQHAAAALVVMDLVGQYDLEQHHIDELLAPVVETFGADWTSR